MSSGEPAIATVIVGHNSARALGTALHALQAQLRDNDEVVVVDNASSDGTAAVARRALHRTVVVRSDTNRGFAGGANIGVDASRAELIFLLNPDANCGSGCLEALRRCAVEQPSWGAWQALVTLPGGERVNTAGNVAHFLGIGWAGRLNEPVELVPRAPARVGFCSGAAMIVRREAWDGVGGFDERYFMYGEDLDLSLRLRLAGWELGIAPAAHVAHSYTFIKGDYKWFYLERNRWWTVVGDYPRRLLALLAPALLVFEAAVIITAWREGWLSAKVRAVSTGLREMPAMMRRRREIQARRCVPVSTFAASLSASLDSPHLGVAARLRGVAAGSRAYWRIVRALLT